MKLSLRVVPLFLFSCLAAFLLMARSIVVYDEGIVLTGAMRVLAGDVIHRDFYANYGPGQFYALAGLFQVFGQSSAAMLGAARLGLVRVTRLGERSAALRAASAIDSACSSSTRCRRRTAAPKSSPRT